MCVGSPTQEKMWIDVCEMKQGSAAKADHKAAAEGRGAGRVQITSRARLSPFSNSTEFGTAVVFATEQAGS